MSPGDSNSDRQPEMAAKTRNTYISEAIRDSIEISMTNPGFTACYKELKECVGMWLQWWPTTRSSNIAAKTGYSYISGNVTDSVEIPNFANLAFLIVVSLTEVLSSDCDTDRQPQRARLAPKMAMLPFLVIIRCHNRLQILHLSLLLSKIPDLSLEF